MSEFGSSFETMKLTFVVNSRKDPELFRWLQNHPFKSMSEAIRALLNIGAAAMTAIPESLNAISNDELLINKKQQSSKLKKSKGIQKNALMKTQVKDTESSDKPRDVINEETVKLVISEIETNNELNNREDAQNTENIDAAYAAFQSLSMRFS